MNKKQLNTFIVRDLLSKEIYWSWCKVDLKFASTNLALHLIRSFSYLNNLKWLIPIFSWLNLIISQDIRIDRISCSNTCVSEGHTILARARYKYGSNVTLTSVRAKIDEHAVMFSSNAVKQPYSYLQTSAGRFPCNPSGWLKQFTASFVNKPSLVCSHLPIDNRHFRCEVIN